MDIILFFLITEFKINLGVLIYCDIIDILIVNKLFNFFYLFFIYLQKFLFFNYLFFIFLNFIFIFIYKLVL